MSDVAEESDNNIPSTQKKKHRHRKKQLYASILKQMEFYFSDAALSKDRFLAQLLDKDPFVPLEVFLRFNKIKALTGKTSEIAGALQESKLLEVSEDNTKVKRAMPMAPYDADARTIYVESIPTTADLQWLTSIFQVHGPVAYISLPKYSNTNRIKGFGFVEFNTEEDAKKCLESFVAMGCKLPTNIKAETLASCQGFQPDIPDPISDEQNACEQNLGSKEEEKEVEEPPPKKMKKKHSSENTIQREKQDSDIESKKESIDGDKENMVDMKNDAAEVSAAEQSESAAEGAAPEEGASTKRSKPVRKRKKKDRKKSHKEREKKNLELTARSLQVLSKYEWKVLRNKYLTLQRKHMKALKQVLRTQHTLPENRNKLPVSISQGYAEQPTTSEEPKAHPTAPPEIPFVEGVIVAVKLSEPCVDVKGLRRATKENVHVTFVDVKEGQSDVHIRMDNAEAATQYAASGVFPKARVLTGQEEQDYWEVLKKQQYEKFSGKRKVRGRDRLVNKARQLVESVEQAGTTLTGKHFRFDE